jgi:hypothetical protein
MYVIRVDCQSSDLVIVVPSFGLFHGMLVSTFHNLFSLSGMQESYSQQCWLPSSAAAEFLGSLIFQEASSINLQTQDVPKSVGCARAGFS